MHNLDVGVSLWVGLKRTGPKEPAGFQVPLGDKSMCPTKKITPEAQKIPNHLALPKGSVW